MSAEHLVDRWPVHLHLGPPLGAARVGPAPAAACREQAEQEEADQETLHDALQTRGPRRAPLVRNGRDYWLQTVTPNACSTGEIGFANELFVPPAKQRPTGLFPDSVTISEPESPDRMNELAT